MKKYALAILLFIPIYVALVVCCTPTLYPIYTDKDIVYDPSLIGVWRPLGFQEHIYYDSSNFPEYEVVKSSATVEFKQYEDNAYYLVITQSGDIHNFTAHLVNIGDYLYLDILPMAPEEETNSIYMDHLFPVHSFVRINSIGYDLNMSIIDTEWLDIFLAENPDILDTYVPDGWTDGRLLVTAPTEEIQAWLIENAENEELYDDPVILGRIIEDEDASDDDEPVEENETIEVE